MFLKTLFLKTGSEQSGDIFTAEAAGLAEIAATGTLPVPAVVAVETGNNHALLALQWLDLEQATPDIERELGRCLAEMHRASNEQYGWHRDNNIGLTPQSNKQSRDWVAFYRDQRLQPQLELAVRNGFAGELQQKGGRLLETLDGFFDRDPEPSLLHGDLWGGNWSVNDRRPVIYDPAVYYGDRETDLAMTRLFGGFGRSFYEAYEEAWPLPRGHERRVALYQVYHVLNHLNLFGGGYLGRAIALIDELND